MLIVLLQGVGKAGSGLGMSKTVQEKIMEAEAEMCLLTRFRFAVVMSFVIEVLCSPTSKCYEVIL